MLRQLITPIARALVPVLAQDSAVRRLIIEELTRELLKEVQGAAELTQEEIDTINAVADEVLGG